MQVRIETVKIRKFQIDLVFSEMKIILKAIKSASWRVYNVAPIVQN